MRNYLVIAASRLTNYHDATRVKAENPAHALDLAFEHLHRDVIIEMHPIIEGVVMTQNQQWSFIIIEQSPPLTEQLRLIP